MQIQWTEATALIEDENVTIEKLRAVYDAIGGAPALVQRIQILRDGRLPPEAEQPVTIQDGTGALLALFTEDGFEAWCGAFVPEIGDSARVNSLFNIPIIRPAKIDPA